MKMTSGWETRAVRGLAKKLYGGPNSMKILYKDPGCRAWWVDGHGHGGVFIGVTNPEACGIRLHPYLINGTPVWTDPSGYVALRVYIYEEDVEWAYLVNDNAWFAGLLDDKGVSPVMVLEAAQRTEKQWPRHWTTRMGLAYPTREERIEIP